MSEWISGCNRSARVELSVTPTGTIALRDSVNPSGPMLIFMPGEIREFGEAYKRGAFDELLGDATED